MRNKKFIIHDFCGHPFTLELANNLALVEKSFDTHYLYTKDDLGPKGNFANIKCKNNNITVGYSIPKTNPLKRLIWEISYGIKLRKKILSLNPDYVMCSNTPIIVLLFIIFNNKFKFIWWVQDIFSEAALKLKIIPLPFRFLVSKTLLTIEYLISIKSSSIILISNNFKYFFSSRFSKKISIIENWPSSQGIKKISNKKNKSIIYAGTIGFKHGKEIITKMINYSLMKGYKFTLVSEGKNAEEIKAEFKTNKSFVGLKFLKYSELIEKISSSKGALFVLDDAASRLSIPSKAYTYMLCNTPILGICNSSHDLAKTINKHHIGVVNDYELFFNLIENQIDYKRMLKNISAYSNKFNIDSKSKEFIKVLESLV